METGGSSSSQLCGSRCLGTATRGRSQTGHRWGAQVLELNGKLLPSDMNDCKFATTYGQGEEMENRGRRWQGENGRRSFVRLEAMLDWWLLVLYGCGA